jgi:alkaline phosphatase
MSLLSEKKCCFALLLLLLILNPLHARAEDKRLVLQKARTSTGRNDRPVRPVKNVILLIPDGCSLATVSAARWYQWLLNPDLPALNIDPYLCGTVRTFSINAPIGDSAPTTSCYMTGELSRTGFVATYPPADSLNDLFTVDSTKAYQPLMTVLEAVRLLYGKSTGLVFTCEFPHATPADCASHDYSRSSYTNIGEQMVHNDLDVVFGGGTSYLTVDQRTFLQKGGYEVQTDDLSGLRSFQGRKIWSLFGSRDLPFDIDRDSTITPSLSEMTAKSLQILSKNKKGFFLMVEGSKVDWAAHANEPMAMMTDFLAFDRACKVALDFAKKDGNTAVIILPDHGNSGISIGTNRLPGYDKLTKDQLFGSWLHYKRTEAGMSDLLNVSEHADMKSLFSQYLQIDLTENQVALLDSAKNYLKSPIPLAERGRNGSLSAAVTKIMSTNSCFGFTTGGHTGEEVFVANYHPKGDVLKGVRFGFEVNDYLCSLYKMEGMLPLLTAKYFAKHTAVFRGMDCLLKPSSTGHAAELTVSSGNNKLTVRQNSNVVTLNGRDIPLSTVVVYVDKNQTFYLPASLVDWMN